MDSRLFFVQVPGTENHEHVNAEHYVVGEQGQLNFYGTKPQYTNYESDTPSETYAAGHWQKVRIHDA